MKLSINPSAITQIIRDVYIGKLDSPVSRRSVCLRDAKGDDLAALANELAIEAARRLFTSITDEQALKLARGEARLVSYTDEIRYVADSVSNTRAAIVRYVRDNPGCYWGEVADQLLLGASDRVVFIALVREGVLRRSSHGSERYYVEPGVDS